VAAVDGTDGLTAPRVTFELAAANVDGLTVGFVTTGGVRSAATTICPADRADTVSDRLSKKP
jgi:hypothetical protein